MYSSTAVLPESPELPQLHLQGFSNRICAREISTSGIFLFGVWGQHLLELKAAGLPWATNRANGLALQAGHHSQASCCKEALNPKPQWPLEVIGPFLLMPAAKI